MSNKLQLYIRSGAAQEAINGTLKDGADDFTTSLITVINGNPVLQECEPGEVMRTALKAASMHLPIDPALGLAYIIPYLNSKKITEDGKVKWIKKYEPQLQVGWKGFVQLALRTQQYKTINVTDVREGEYQGTNRLTGSIEFDWIDDNVIREKAPIIGYVGYFRLTNGFEKILYMSTEELEKHARQYSKSYANGNGKWADDKPAMSRKTVVKLLISKWGPQSTQIQKALRADQAAMAEDDSYNYVDNGKDDAPADDVDQTPTEPTEAEAPQAPAKPEPQEAEIVEPEPETPPEPVAPIAVDQSFKDDTMNALDDLKLTSRGRMALINKLCKKPALSMVKSDDEWRSLAIGVGLVATGSEELPADWYEDKQGALL